MKIVHISKAGEGMYGINLMREKVGRGYIFYLEWPVKYYWKVLFRLGDWLLIYKF